MAQIEGCTPLESPATGTVGPGTTSKETPFFNPAMGLNRDLSILLAEWEARRKGRDLEIADALCGAGARTLRLANEVRADVHVFANDLRPDAIATVESQAEHLGIANRITTSRLDALDFLTRRRFDIVDIDPYGSPMPFLDAALAGTRHNGLVCLTATDTAALSGTYRKPCKRRYGAIHQLHPMPWRQEVGLRILAGTAVLAAGRAERHATPVLSIAAGHWMRVICRLGDGRKQADAQMDCMGWASPDDRGCGQFSEAPTAKPFAGPLWTGPLHDAQTIAGLQEHFQGRPSEITPGERDSSAPRPAGDAPPWERPAGPLARPRPLGKMLDAMSSEADPECPAFWVDLDEFAGAQSMDTPPREAFIAALEESGHKVWRVQGEPKGIRTRADHTSITAAIKAATTAKPT